MSWVTKCPTPGPQPAPPGWHSQMGTFPRDGFGNGIPLHCQGTGTASPHSAREIQQEEPAGHGWFGKCQGSSGRALPAAAAAAERLGVLRVTAPSSSSASPSPAARKITLRGAKERPELTQVCRETSHSPLRMTLSNAHWPLPGWPSQEWKCLFRTTGRNFPPEGGVDRSCSQLQTSPHCLSPQVYKNAGFPLPELQVGSGRKVAQAGRSWATATTTTGGRCS